MVDFTLNGLTVIFLSLLTFYLIIYKRIDVIGEPISILSFVLSFSISLVFIIYGFSDYMILIFIHIVTLLIFISIGCIFFRRFFNVSNNTSFNYTQRPTSTFKLGFLSFFSWLSFLIIMIMNLVHLYKNGSALFSEDIDEAKTMGFSDGGGIIRRLNWSLLYFNFFCFFVLYHLTKNKIYLFSITILILLLLSLGSKGALIDVILIISILYSSRYFFQGNIKKLNFTVTVLGAIGLVFSVIVYALTVQSAEMAFAKMYTRLLYFGDINLYLGSERISHVLSSYDFFDFIDYLFNPLLGFFRITDYYTPLGTQFVNAYNAGSQSVDGNYGPNLTFYATAILFFGDYTGLVFSALVGFFVGFLKSLSSSISITNVVRYIVYCYCYFMCFTLVLDPLMFAGRVFDSILIIGSLFTFSKIIWFFLKSIKSTGLKIHHDN
jgi:hypothetical protein